MRSIVRKVIRRIQTARRRRKNRRTVFKYPSCADGWVKNRIPVIGKPGGESFFDPYVLRTKDAFVMYVSARNRNSIIKCTSKDGEEWIEETTAIYGLRNGKWDDCVNRACVIERDSQFLMWYTGQSNNTSCIGAAVSKDGNRFERIMDLPVIKATEKYEGVSVMNPCVIWDKNKKVFKMWYSAGENYEPDVICYAESQDGIEWKKNEHNPVLIPGNQPFDHYKVGGCDVKIIDGKYWMFYIGYENIDNARICLAYSVDGLNWFRAEHNPIIAPSAKSWDSDAIYKPSFLAYKDFYYLWYNGRRKRAEYIGLAIRRISENV